MDAHRKSNIRSADTEVGANLADPSSAVQRMSGSQAAPSGRRQYSWQRLVAQIAGPAYARFRSGAAAPQSGGTAALTSLTETLDPAVLLDFSEDLHRFAAACGHEAIARLDEQAQREVPAHLDEVKTISDGMEVSVMTGQLRNRASAQVTAQQVAITRNTTLQGAARDVERARILHQDTPDVLHALTDGQIGAQHANTMVDLSRKIKPSRPDIPWNADPAAIEAYDQQVIDAEVDCRQKRQDLSASLLETAAGRTPGTVKRAGTRLLNRVLEASASDRYASERKDRRVRITPGDNGMCQLYAYLPALAGEAIENRLTELATLHTDASIDAAIADRYPADSSASDGSAADQGDSTDAPISERTRAQARADAFVELLLAGPNGSGLENVKAAVTITVPATVFPGLSHLDPAGQNSPGDPASRRAVSECTAGTSTSETPEDGLTGLRLPRGNVLPETEMLGAFDPADLAPLLPHTSTWSRVITDPWTGAVTAFDTDKYRPTAAMRRALALRDRTCRTPGCGRRASVCEPDHIIERQHGGPTELDNLVSCCKRCHRLKSWGLLRLTLSPDGTIQATTWWDQRRAGAVDAPWDTPAQPVGSTDPMRSRSAMSPVEAQVARGLNQHLEWVNRRATGYTTLTRPPMAKARGQRRVEKIRSMRRLRADLPDPDENRASKTGADRPDSSGSVNRRPQLIAADQRAAGTPRTMSHLGYSPSEVRDFQRDAAAATAYPAWLSWEDGDGSAASNRDGYGNDTSPETA